MNEFISADRIWNIITIIITPFAAIYLSHLFNKRQKKQEDNRAERITDVDEFSEHRQAFKMRIDQLETALANERRERREANERHSREIGKLQIQLEDLSKENTALLRANFHLNRLLDECKDDLSRRRGAG